MSHPDNKASTMTTTHDTNVHPWRAFSALIIGFFMILVDSTIVMVAMPALIRELGAGLSEAVWVTSAYLLAYAVPLLITGRLGDRVGPRWVYLLGLVVFTFASLWCGLAGDITMLIVARVVQGFGASLMAPQTMTVITRVFPAEERGPAMGVWGSVAGIAMIVGPILGGVLIDGLGWQWIFFINVPVGVVAFLAAWMLVPRLETHTHRFDWVGVALSAVAMFAIVFGIQEGEQIGWGVTWPLILAGVVIMAVFFWWQRRVNEPLIPLELFRDRNFTGANIVIFLVGAIAATSAIPEMLYFQSVLGLTPTGSALMLLPMALVGAVLAPFVGKRVQRADARPVAFIGLLSFAAGCALFGVLMTPNQNIAQLLAAGAVFGVANACTWGPVSITATRNLPMSMAGAGSGVYNTTRQLGAVLGSAALAAIMSARLAEHLGQGAAQHMGEGPAASAGALPPFVAEGFARSMGESMYVLAVLAAVAAFAVLFWERPKASSTHKA